MCTCYKGRCNIVFGCPSQKFCNKKIRSTWLEFVCYALELNVVALNARFYFLCLGNYICVCMHTNIWGLPSVKELFSVLVFKWNTVHNIYNFFSIAIIKLEQSIHHVLTNFVFTLKSCFRWRDFFRIFMFVDLHLTKLLFHSFTKEGVCFTRPFIVHR